MLSVDSISTCILIINRKKIGCFPVRQSEYDLSEFLNSHSSQELLFLQRIQVNSCIDFFFWMNLFLITRNTDRRGVKGTVGDGRESAFQLCFSGLQDHSVESVH